MGWAKGLMRLMMGSSASEGKTVFDLVDFFTGREMGETHVGPPVELQVTKGNTLFGKRPDAL
jgi:hypothetical protein